VNRGLLVPEGRRGWGPGVVGVSLGTDEGNKPAFADVFDPGLAMVPADRLQDLEAFAHRHDESATFTQLGEEGVGKVGCSGGDHDAVVGATVGATECAVTHHQFDIPATEPLQHSSRLAGEFGNAFDADDALTEPGENRCLVAASRADFEHGLAPRQPEFSGHQGNKIWLADGLPLVDGKGRIVVRLSDEIGRDKPLAGNFSQDLQDPFVLDSLPAEKVNEVNALLDNRRETRLHDAPR